MELLAEIQARHAARIAADLPPDSLEQAAEEQAEQQVPDADIQPEEEEEVQGKADPTPPAAGFGMSATLTEFEVAQAEEAAEQQTILDSIHLEAEVKANYRYLREAERDELFVGMEFDEEPKLLAEDQEAGSSGTASTEVVYVSDDE